MRKFLTLLTVVVFSGIVICSTAMPLAKVFASDTVPSSTCHDSSSEHSPARESSVPSCDHSEGIQLSAQLIREYSPDSSPAIALFHSPESVRLDLLPLSFFPPSSPQGNALSSHLISYRTIVLRI